MKHLGLLVTVLMLACLGDYPPNPKYEDTLWECVGIAYCYDTPDDTTEGDIFMFCGMEKDLGILNQEFGEALRDSGFYPELRCDRQGGSVSSYDCTPTNDRCSK